MRQGEPKKPLEALKKYFNIKKAGSLYEVRCKRCSKGWGVPLADADNFNPLGLFNHAFMHEDAGKPQEECIE